MPEQVASSNFFHDGQVRTAKTDASHGLLADACDWTAKNVINPAANGAFVESYNAIAGTVNAVSGHSADSPLMKEAKPLAVDKADFMTVPWLVQTVSGGIGTLLPYVVAGKVMGGAMRATGETFELKGMSATFLKSDRAAQILGAGLYDGMRTPRDGETRFSNALAGMAGFGVFEYGNALSIGLAPGNRVLARIGVGALGAGTQQTVSHLVSQGELPTWKEYTEAGVSGGAMNLLLPVAQRGMMHLADHLNDVTGRGVPVDRLVSSKYQNPYLDQSSIFKGLTSDTWARVRQEGKVDSEFAGKNLAETTDAQLSPEKLAAMLKRLQSARSNNYEAEYKAAAEHLNAGETDKAWEAFKRIRLNQEVDQFDARLVENRVVRDMETAKNKANSSGEGKEVKTDEKTSRTVTSPGLRDAINELVAKSQQPSEEAWKNEFEQFKSSGGKYRPAPEFRGTADATKEAKEVSPEQDALEGRALAMHLVKALQAKGYTTVFAGGAVRDEMRGYIPKDYDIATSATPDQVEQVFKDSGATVFDKGRSFGVMAVAIDGKVFEIATLRTDGQYSDGRRPDSVQYVTSLMDDAARRDLTVNAMFLDPVSGQLHDFFGGQEDLAKGIIRAVGDPNQRIAEDPLRMLRAARFTAKMGFDLDSSLLKAIQDNAGKIQQTAPERWREEVKGLLTSKDPVKGLNVMRQTGLMHEVLPEVEPMFGPKGEQDPFYHSEGNAGVHTFEVVGNLSKIRGEDWVLMLAGLLHDNAKPDTQVIHEDGRISNHGHDAKGAEKAAAIADRLKMSNDEKNKLVALVQDHMKMHTVKEMRPATLARLMNAPYFEEKMALQHADARSTHVLDGSDFSHHGFLTQELERMRTAAEPSAQLNAKEIINGDVLKGMEYRQGPLFRIILDAAKDAQVEGRFTDLEQGKKWVTDNYDQYRSLTLQQQTEMFLPKKEGSDGKKGRK